MINKIVFKKVLLVLLSVFIISSCATLGTEFDGKYVEKVKIGVTKKSDISEMFGNPWRIGIDNGNKAWTYGYYHFKIFKGIETRDLYVVFDSEGVVKSYTFNKSDFKK